MNFFLLKEYIGYWLHSLDEHSLHSPFVFDLYTKVIKKVPESGNFLPFEDLRDQMLSDDTRINTQSFGAPSKVDSNRKRKVSNIAKYGTSSRKYSQLFYSLGTYFNHQNIWELGTSLGINTLYLASIPNAKVVTFEGCGETLELAKKNFSLFEKKNITLIEGNLDDTLLNELGKTRELDLVFFDANHRYDPTLRYFEACSTKSHASSLFIFDDIHWSEEMKSAWQEIIRHPMSRITIDLFQVGLVFLDPELPQQHYILEF